MSPRRALAPLVGGLLVGGRSSRFGRPKALEPHAGTTFAERAVAALGAVAGEVHLLGDGEVPPALAALPRLADRGGRGGPLAGVLAALAQRPDRGWLIVACDQPYLSAELCRWLADQRDPERLAVLPRLTPERIQPFPAVYEPAALAVLEAVARGADPSLQRLGLRPDVATPEPPAALRPAFRDVDTPDDLADPRG
jgi:molybdenum cofactor guanylyltransferase